MKFQRGLVLALPALSLAYPGMMGSRSDIEDMLKAHAVAEVKERDVEERQLLPDLLGSISSLVNGLLGSVASAVNPSNKRPEPGFTFQAPGPRDSRGPCPGLNLLANYGYLPRNGRVNLGQVIQATSRGFNMGADLAAILTTFAILTDGDIATQSFYLGTNPDTKTGGLNRHSTVEADVSPNREDFYNGCGDNHHLSSRMFKQNVGLASRSSSKQFDLDVMGSQYALNAAFSRQNNPFLYYFPFPMIVSLGAFAFYPQFFSNGTFGAGGVANYESISSIIGAEYDAGTNQFRYVPEKWPENWYRRATPYGAVQTVLEGYTRIYPRFPLVPGVAQLGGPNLNATTVLCDLYQGLNSIVPLVLAGRVQNVAEAVSWATGVLDPYLGRSALGCPGAALSPNPPGLFPSPSKVGGPLATPSAQASNIGNNVYGRTYFRNAPARPQCNPAAN